MSRSSPVTARERPVAASTSTTGAVLVQGETFTVETDGRIHLVI